MRIVIDMQGLQTEASKNRGVGRYTEYLVKAVLQQNDRHEIFLAMNGAFPDSIEEIKNKFCDILPIKYFVVWQNYFYTSYTHDSGCFQKISKLIRESLFWQLKADVVFSTNLQEGYSESAVNSVREFFLDTTYVSTLHDLVPFYMGYVKDNPCLEKWYFEKIKYVEESDFILTVSNSSKKDILKFLKINDTKVHVVENGYNSNIFNSSQLSNANICEIRKKFTIDYDYILYAGGDDPHKNLENLIKAYASDYKILGEVKLVLVGKALINNKTIRDLIRILAIESNVVLLGYVNDNDLVSLMKCSRAFVFPSLYEGFGLPALEAMACGVPTIGSNQSSISEVIEDINALFNPNDILDIAMKIKQVLFDEDFTKKIISKAFERSKYYSWEYSASKFLSVVNDFPISSSMEFDIEVLIRKVSSILDYSVSDNDLIKIVKSIDETLSFSSIPKIYVDISSVIIQDDKTGIQRVTRAISFILKTKYPEIVDVVYFDNELDCFCLASDFMNEKIINTGKKTDEPIYLYKGDTLLYLDLHPGLAIKQRCNNINLVKRNVNVYHVVYDLIPVNYPHSFNKDVVEQFRDWLSSISYSSGAFCISSSVAIDLQNYLRRNNLLRKCFKVEYFHLGADIKNSISTDGGVDENAKEMISIIENNISFLMVGTLEPRKGHLQTIKAFEELCKENNDCCLVIVGKIGWLSEDLEKYILSNSLIDKKIFWLRGISDEYLEEVYKVCKCLIAASEAEGFGLPLIEAAQHEIPIIARDIPVFREVALDYAYYFQDSKDPAAIKQALREWLFLYKDNTHPKSHNMPYLTWEQSAQQLFDIISYDY